MVGPDVPGEVECSFELARAGASGERTCIGCVTVRGEPPPELLGRGVAQIACRLDPSYDADTGNSLRATCRRRLLGRHKRNCLLSR